MTTDEILIRYQQLLEGAHGLIAEQREFIDELLGCKTEPETKPPPAKPSHLKVIQ